MKSRKYGHCWVYDGEGGTTGLEHGVLMRRGPGVLVAGVDGPNDVGVDVGVG